MSNLSDNFNPKTMKKHIQQFTGQNRGSCYPTAIACVLGLELNEVPNVNLLYFNELQLRVIELETDIKQSDADYMWYHVMCCFLAARDIREERYTIEHGKLLIEEHGKYVAHLIHGLSPRDINHSCVGIGGKLWHDPHPEGGGLIREDEFVFYRNIRTNEYLKADILDLI